MHFNDAWLQLPHFSDWLVKVTNDDTRAYCRWCALVLRAHKRDLADHGTTPKHIENGKLGGTGPEGPITVQIVSNDTDVNDEDIKNVDEVANNGTTTTVLTPSPNKRQHRYRTAWEVIPELQNWLSEYALDQSKAYCRVCDLLLRAHKHDLMVHSRSVRHKTKEQEMGILPPLTQPTNELSTLEGDIGEDHGEWTAMDNPGTSPLNPKKPKLEGIGPLKNVGIGTRRSNKKIQFTTTDVLDAIERNYFNQDELLCIVKAAVPKL